MKSQQGERWELIKGTKLSDRLVGIYFGEPLPEVAHDALQIVQRLRFKKFQWRLGLFEFDHLVLKDGSIRSSHFYQQQERSEGMQIYEQFLEEAIHPEARLKMRGTELIAPSECPWYIKKHYRLYASYVSDEFQVGITLFDKGVIAQLKPFHYSRRACLELVVGGNSQVEIQPLQEEVDLLYQELVYLSKTTKFYFKP